MTEDMNEPVLWLMPDGNTVDKWGLQFYKNSGGEPPYGGHPLYRKPQRAAWVDLTDEEVEQGYETTGHYQTLRPQDRFAVFALARAIEAKLKEKNT